jgi:hypothetical protein
VCPPLGPGGCQSVQSPAYSRILLTNVTSVPNCNVAFCFISKLLLHCSERRRDIVWSEAFAATGFNKIFSSNQTRQMNKRNRRFVDHLGLHHQGCHLYRFSSSLMMKTEMVLETSISFIHLTRLIALKDFMERRQCKWKQSDTLMLVPKAGVEENCRKGSFEMYRSVFS